MSDDQIKLVQSLIESGKGDIGRLQVILDALQKGNLLNDDDQNYLQEIAKSQPGEIATQPSSPLETPSVNVTPEAKLPEQQNSSDDVSQERKPLASKSTLKKRIITIAGIIAIVLSVYVALDVYSVYALQFRPHHGNQYLISETQVFIQSDVCNPSYFPASFSKYKINAFYKSYSVETAEISGSTISPKTYETLNGIFTLNKDTVTKLQQGNFTFDPNQAHVTTSVEAPIFGVIPFSVVKDYAGEEFQKVLKNGPPGSFSCG